MVDSIANILTCIRNALAVKKPDVVLPFSDLKKRIAEILKQNGYIKDYNILNKPPQRDLRIILKYTKKSAAIKKLSRISKPGRRVYRGYRELEDVKGGLGITIVSTPQGLMTDKEARKKKLGGEVICEIF